MSTRFFNPVRDLPLLTRVLDSRFVTHSQLYRFMRRAAAEFDRQVFNWRVRRLRSHGLIYARTVPFLAAEPISSITPSGVLALESQGQLPFAAWIGRERSAGESQIPHSLELNNIELALRENGPVVLWTPENRVRCLHTYLPGTYAKVYDTAVEARIGELSLKLALEYEATQKTFARYEKIRREIEAGRRIDVTVCVASSWELKMALVTQFYAFAGRRDPPCHGFLSFRLAHHVGSINLIPASCRLSGARSSPLWTEMDSRRCPALACPLIYL